MPFDPNQIEALLRAKREHERMVDAHRSILSDVEVARQRMRDLVDPPWLRELKESASVAAGARYLRGFENLLSSSAQLRQLADVYLGTTSIGAAATLAGTVAPGVFQNLAAFAMPTDHLAGLKALMSPETLSSSIVKSLTTDVSMLAALSRSTNLLRSHEPLQHSREMRSMLSLCAASTRTLSALDVTRTVADRLNVHDVTRALIEFETSRLNRAFAGFGANLINHPAWLGGISGDLAVAPSQSVFAQSRFVRVVTTHEVEEDSAADEIWEDVQSKTLGFVAAMLPELNPKLMTSWDGAWTTAKRRGPDWVRQSAVSMRVVLIQTLDATAPMDQVQRDKTCAKLIAEKKTRLAQVHWLCEPVKNRTYGKVVRADLDSAMTVIEALNEAVHGNDDEIESAFDTMSVRAAIALANLLRVWKLRRS